MLATLLLLTALSAEPPVDDVPARFAAAISTGSRDALDALAIDPPIRGPKWTDAANLVDGYRCASIRVTNWRVTNSMPGSRTLRVNTVGVELVRGSPGRTVPVWHTWTLELERKDGAWKIRSAERAPATIARALLDAPDEAQRERILAENTDLELGSIARAMAHELFRPPQRDEKWFAYARELAGRGGSVVDLSIVAQALSIDQTGKGRHAESLVNAQLALDLGRQSGDLPAIVTALWGTALRGNAFDQDMREAIDMIDQLPDPRIALRMQTVVTSREGVDLPRALAEADRLAKLSRQYEWPEGELNALLLLANLHASLRNYDATLLHVEEALRRAKADRNELVAAVALHNVALSHLARGDMRRGIEIMRRSVIEADRHLVPLQQANVWRDLGTALRKQGSFADAEAALTRALARATIDTAHPLEPGMAGTVHTRFAELRLAQRRFREAEEEARRAAEMLAPMDGSEELIRAMTVRASALRALDNGEEALAELQRAISLLDSTLQHLPADEISRAAFLDDYLEPFSMTIDLLVEAGRIEEAALLSERMRARELRDTLARGNVDLSETMSAEELQEEQRLQQKIVTLTRGGGEGLDAARAELRAFYARLYLERPELRLRRGGDRRDDERIAAPPAGTAVISFVVAASRTIAFTVTRGTGGEAQVAAKSIPIDAAELQSRAARFARQLNDRDLHYGESARSLYKVLFGTADLARYRLVYFVPHDVLWSIPLHALRDAAGTPLVRRVAVAYAPSIAFAKASNARAASRLLAIAGPLHDAEREASALVAIYGKERSRLYAGAEARESTFKKEAPRFDVLHIATHGFVDDDNPMYSALELSASGDAHEDGRLEAREILRLDLHAQLAVLSACETGRGKIARGEGVIGLAWAFLAAGCPRTVVSQWKAESASTKELMIAFHRALRGGEAPAHALRTAQLALMRKPGYEHPFYWAPFIVVEAAR